MTQDVTGCGGCPFSYMGYHYWGCSHHSAPEDNIITDQVASNDAGEPPPEWCPLRIEPITISLII